nr:TPA_asm: P3a protein [Prunus humilis associated luteovirus]
MDFKFLSGFLVGFLSSVPVSITAFFCAWFYFTKKVQKISEQVSSPRRF